MRSSYVRVGALALALAAGACGESTTEPDAALEQLSEEVALMSADAVSEDLEVMSSIVPGALLAPEQAILDITRSRVVEYFDAEGNEQDRYDPLTTASIHTTLVVEGEASGAGFEWSVNRSRDMTVTGLEGEETERTWNGSGEESRSRASFVVEGETRSYEMSGTLLVEDVVRGVPRTEHPYPLSGSITRSVTITVVNGPRGDETITREIVVTFNGTRYAEVTVGEESFELDLDGEGRARIRRPRADT